LAKHLLLGDDTRFQAKHQVFGRFVENPLPGHNVIEIAVSRQSKGLRLPTEPLPDFRIVNDNGGYAVLSGPGECIGAGVIGAHEHDLAVYQASFARIYDSLQLIPFARNQHADADTLVHNRPPVFQAAACVPLS